MTDTRLEGLARRYKASVAGRYRAIRPSDLQLIPHAPCFVSRKLDGELWLAELHNGKARLFARGGRRLEAGPLLKALAALAKGRKQPLVIAGELHVRSTDGGRERVGDVAAALAADEHERLAFAAFDVVELDGAPPPADYHPRLELLRDLLSKSPLPQLSVVDTEELREPAELRPHLDRWVVSGDAEGLVVRSIAGEIYKIKPSFSLDAVVVGFTTRVTESDQVRSVLLGLRRDDASIQLLGACGNFPGEDMRRELLAALEALECASGFRHSSSDGNLYRFVRPELVLELSCTDLQTDDSDGAPVRRWVLRHGDEGWQPIVDAQSASMIHPVVVRRRTDKRADGLDVRLSQLQEHLPELDPQVPLEPRHLPRSQPVRRQVWTKAGKGGIAVRKLVVWKSGKEEAWPGWPSWLVHFTDYSPDRKTPLERTLRTARTEEEANVIAEALIVEHIKKGWEEVGSTDERTAAKSEPQKSPPKAATKQKTGKSEKLPAKKSATKKL